MNFPCCFIVLIGFSYLGKIEGVSGYDIKVKGYEVDGKDYFDLSGLKMIKIGKKKYGFNGTVIVHQDITNDLHVSCAACKKTGNHYIENLAIHIKDMIFCNIYEDDQYISQDYKRSINAPMKCPLKKGNYDVINYTPEAKNIPEGFPEGEWRVINDFTITKDDKRELISKTTMYLYIEHDRD